MPANATTHRPPVAVSYGDSPRREQQQQMQGDAFRSALDSIEQPAPSDRLRGQELGKGRAEDKASRRDDALAADRRDDALAADRRDDALAADRRDDALAADRRDDALAADRRDDALAADRRDDALAADRRDDALTADRRDDAMSAERRDEDRAAERRAEQVERQSARSARQDGASPASDEQRPMPTSGNEVQETPPSSVGGFGSAPAVSELSETAGAVRTDNTPGAAFSGPSRSVDPLLVAAAQPKSAAAAKTAGASLLPPTGDPAIVALPLARPAAEGPRIPGGPGLAADEAAQSPAAANPLSAEAEAQLASDDAPLPPALDRGASELSRTAKEAEFKLPGAARDAGTKAAQSNAGQGTQVQAGASGTLDAGLRGLGGGANRAGLEAGHQAGATPDLYQDPEPLPGSVRLRGLRGARLSVPTEDGQTIHARVDLTDEQVDIRLSAPEGSAEQAARRTSELRQALASQGLELGEFDVSTSEHGRADNNSEGAEQGNGNSSGNDSNNQQAPAVDPWGRPIGTETARGSAADGRGSLLDLRL